MHLAALDLGSNSVKLLLLQRQPGGGLVEIMEPARVTRLAAGVDKSGRLAEDRMVETLEAVAEFLRQIPEGVHGLGVAVATSAVRDAANGQAFLDRVAALLHGCRPLLISGEEEATTVFRGAASDRPADEICACIDAGGGSTEIAVGASFACGWHTSLPLGCVRLGEKFSLLDAAKPEAATQAADAVRKTAAEACAEIGKRFRNQPLRFLASGGTAACLGAIAGAGSIAEKARLHGMRIPLPDIRSWADRLLPMTVEERRRVPGMPGDRAAVLPAGLLILSEILVGLGAAELTLTSRGLRYGLALRLLAGEIEPVWRW